MQVPGANTVQRLWWLRSAMSAAQATAVEDAKQQLRLELKARRRGLNDEFRAQASREAARQVVRSLRFHDDTKIALFWPLGTEIDTGPLRLSLHNLGAMVLLPRTHARATPLTFHRWRPNIALEKSSFGVMEPPASQPVQDPDIVVVPLLGFDSSGHRIGYGAGHYDCTLADLHRRGHFPRTVGLAFEVQCVDEVPSLDHDMPLDMIITEERAWHRPA